MGGFLSDVVDSVTGAFDDVVDFVSAAANDLIEIAKDTAKFITDVTMTVTGTKWLDEQLTGGLLYNSITGTIDNVGGMLSGAVNGDWVQFRDGAMGTITTAVAVAAIIGGAIAQQWWLVAAGVTVLDAQHNEGELLRRSIAIAADIETAITNTHYIEEYAMEIQMLITVVASIYAGAEGGTYLFNELGVSAALAQWSSDIAMIQNVVGAGYGAYQIYSAIAAIKASQAYWAEQLKAAEEYYRDLIAKAQAARDQWFNMMIDPDLINRIQAGGDLFVMGAGHDLFSITSVAEPRFALGLIDRSDGEMDKTINNRFYLQSAGNDGFKIQ